MAADKNDVCVFPCWYNKSFKKVYAHVPHKIFIENIFK